MFTIEDMQPELFILPASADRFAYILMQFRAIISSLVCCTVQVYEIVHNCAESVSAYDSLFIILEHELYFISNCSYLPLYGVMVLKWASLQYFALCSIRFQRVIFYWLC